MYRFEIPWPTPGSWREINGTLHMLTVMFHPELEPAREMARRVRNRLMPMFPLMDDLCTETCPECREPCCRVATLWYNFQDLLFLHLTDQPLALAQPLSLSRAVCRYLGAKGCTLPRIARPWICTWYVCPPQTSLLRRRWRSEKKRLDPAIEEIKTMRKGMETAFLEAVSGRRSQKTVPADGPER